MHFWGVQRIHNAKKIPLALTLVASTDHINKHLAEVEKDMGRHYFTI